MGAEGSACKEATIERGNRPDVANIDNETG